jgi:putative flippase GtrA
MHWSDRAEAAARVGIMSLTRMIHSWSRSNIRQLTAEVARIIRFGIVGIAATLVYAGVTYLVVETGVAKPIMASVIGQLTAGFISYFGHLRFSFAVDPDHKSFVWRFLVIAAVTFAMNIGVTFLLTEVLGLSYRVSIVVVTVLIPITNYLCNRFWVFHSGLKSLAKTGRT